MAEKVCPKCAKKKDTSEFNKAAAKRDGLQSYCKFCSGEVVKALYKYNSEERREKQIAWDKLRRDRKQQFVLKYLLIHPCIDCGEADIVVLQFDHIIPVKDGKGRRILAGSSITKSTFEEEISKCVVRCANCHVRRHRRDSNDYRFQYMEKISNE